MAGYKDKKEIEAQLKEIKNATKNIPERGRV